MLHWKEKVIYDKNRCNIMPLMNKKIDAPVEAVGIINRLV